jgi:hypothetical protein
MASNLACVGLAISSNKELQELISRVLPLSTRLGARDGLEVRRWQDESGARLLFGLRAGAVVEFLPSLAAAPGAILGPIVVLNDEVSSAAILDEQGEQLTSAAFELEERGLLNETASRRTRSCRRPGPGGNGPRGHSPVRDLARQLARSVG